MSAYSPAGPVLTGLALARGEVDRAAHLRADDAWLEGAWADPGTRVLVVEHGRALCAIDDRQARLCFVSPANAPDGVRFLLGVDHDGRRVLRRGRAAARACASRMKTACGRFRCGKPGRCCRTGTRA